MVPGNSIPPEILIQLMSQDPSLMAAIMGGSPGGPSMGMPPGLPPGIDPMMLMGGLPPGMPPGLPPGIDPMMLMGGMPPGPPMGMPPGPPGLPANMPVPPGPVAGNAPPPPPPTERSSGNLDNLDTSLASAQGLAIKALEMTKQPGLSPKLVEALHGAVEKLNEGIAASKGVKSVDFDLPQMGDRITNEENWEDEDIPDTSEEKVQQAYNDEKSNHSYSPGHPLNNSSNKKKKKRQNRMFIPMNELPSGFGDQEMN